MGQNVGAMLQASERGGPKHGDANRGSREPDAAVFTRRASLCETFLVAHNWLPTQKRPHNSDEALCGRLCQYLERLQNRNADQNKQGVSDSKRRQVLPPSVICRESHYRYGLWY